MKHPSEVCTPAFHIECANKCTRAFRFSFEAATKTESKEEKRKLTEVQRQAKMTWAKWLKRVFKIDVEKCPSCEGNLKIIQCVESPEVIKKILDHFNVQNQRRRKSSISHISVFE